MKKGFSLTELILSIGIISITGIIVVNLFIKSETLGRKARDLDKSVFIASGIIEALKSVGTPSEIPEHEYLADAVFYYGKDGIRAELNYDSSWKPVTGRPAGGAEDRAEDISNVAYSIILVIAPSEESAPKVYDVGVRCLTRSTGGKDGRREAGEEIIYELKTALYLENATMIEDDYPAGGDVRAWN